MSNTTSKSTLEQLTIWMAAREDEHLEFKEAKNNFHFEKLVQYCCALANEQGGQMILGVTDRKPRRVRQLLQELKRFCKIHVVGITRSARWFPGEAD